VDSENFGLVFVTPEDYDEYREHCFKYLYNELITVACFDTEYKNIKAVFEGVYTDPYYVDFLKGHRTKLKLCRWFEKKRYFAVYAAARTGVKAKKILRSIKGK